MFSASLFVPSVVRGVSGPPGDCDGDGIVAAADLVSAVTIALGSSRLERCSRSDSNGDGRIAVDELVAAVRFALGFEIKVDGACSRPGPAGREPPGLVACDEGAAEPLSVRLSRCDRAERSRCLDDPSSLVVLGFGSISAGHFSLSIDSRDAGAALVAEVELVDPTSEMSTRYRSINFGLLGSGGAAAADSVSLNVVLGPTTEAATRIVQENGFETYFDEGVRAIQASVEAANGTTNFAGAELEQAVALAGGAAARDQAVADETEANRILAFDSPFTATLDVAGDVDRYAFTLPIRTEVSIAASSVDGTATPCLSLTSGSGVPIAGPECDSSPALDRALDAGDYFVLVSDLGGDDTGSYRLSLLSPSSPTSTATLSPTPTEPPPTIPTPTSSPTPTLSPMPTDSPTPADSPTPTESPTPMESPTPTESPTPADSPTPTSTSTPSCGECARLAVGSASGRPGEEVRIGIFVGQGADDGMAGGGADEIAAIAFTVLIPGLELATCDGIESGMPAAIEVSPAFADVLGVVVENAACVNRERCLCPGPGQTRDEFVNIVIFGPKNLPEAGPIDIPLLPDGEVLGLRLRIPGDAGGSVPLTLVAAGQFPPPPQFTAVVSVGDRGGVDRTFDTVEGRSNVESFDGVVHVDSGGFLLAAVPRAAPWASQSRIRSPAGGGSGSLAGDADCDGIVSPADLAPLITALFTADISCPGGADANGDRVLSAADVVALILLLASG